ncbi:MAG: GntP family permease [Ilyomonas sp.]
MTASFIQVLLFLIIGVAIIILLTAKFRVHAFFALIIACFVTGIGVSMPITEVIETMKTGFGDIMKSLGLIIVLGTTLGVLLEHTGSTKVMAAFILKNTGERNAALAMSITGFIVGMPVFCDSGYIVLNGLNKSLAKRTGRSIAIMSVSLASGLYAVHCLIPPHPGATAAAVTINVDFGKMIIYGIIIAIPAMLAGYFWAVYAGRKITEAAETSEEVIDETKEQPSVLVAFLPIIIPVVLIAIKSFLSIDQNASNDLEKIFSAIGDPVTALAIGVILAFFGKRNWNKQTVAILLQEAAEKAGGILVIIGAGGAFGAILGATKIGEHFSSALSLGSLGILFPFLLTFVLKTAQGSSTVAIITAASIVHPLIAALGLDSENGRLLCVLSMGAGSMMISHANDAYFWVIAKFSGLQMRTMLKVYTVSTILMGIVSLLMIYLLSFLI